MEGNINKKIGMIFELDINGKYIYKLTEIFNDSKESKDMYDQCCVIELDEKKYSNIRDKKDTDILINKDIQEKEKLLLELSDSLYEKLLNKCKLDGNSDEESLNVMKDSLDYIAKNILSIELKKRGNISALCVDCESEKKLEEVDESKKTAAVDEEVQSIDMSKVNPDEIIDKIKKKVIAQDSVVETVVNNIYNNQLIVDSKDDNLISTSKANIFLDGPTGTGKTLIIKEVAKELSIPMIIRSSTMYSASGYRGSELNEMLIGLLEQTGGNLELAERGIVVLDEFDKLASDGDNELEMKKAVQQELLTYLSGGKFPVEYKGKTYEFDTSKITFIALGAFTDLRERKIKEELDKDGYYSMKPEDYIQEGLLREIVGRFSLFTATQSLEKDDLINILKRSEISQLHHLKEFAKKQYGKEIVCNDEMIDRIAAEAYSTNTGARALQTIMNGIRNVILSDLRNKEVNVIEINNENFDKSKEVEKRKGVKK